MSTVTKMWKIAWTKGSTGLLCLAILFGAAFFACKGPADPSAKKASVAGGKESFDKNPGRSAVSDAPPLEGSPSTPMPYVTATKMQPIPTAGWHLTTSMDVLKKTILAMAKEGRDLPRLFSSTVFASTDIQGMTFTKDTVIGDIGCGPGALEVDLILRKQPFKKIYAVDIDASSLQILQFLLDNYFPRGKKRIELVHSAENDVKLPEKSLDLAILHDAHFFVDNAEGRNMQGADDCLRSLRRALKPEGRLHVHETISVVPIGGKQPEMRWISDPFLRAGFRLESSSAEHGSFAFVFRP